MRHKVILFIFIFLAGFFVQPCFTQAVKVKVLLYKRKKELMYIRKKLKNLKLLEKELLKLYINLHIKNFFRNRVLTSPKNINSEDLKEDLKIIENILLKKVLSIQKEIDFFNKRYKLVTKEVERLKLQESTSKILKSNKKKNKNKKQKPEVAYLVENGSIKPGTYTFNITKPIKVRSPIPGTVKFISYKENNMMLVIENNNCKVYFKNLDKVKVNIGDYVSANATIGVVNQPKKLQVTIECKH